MESNRGIVSEPGALFTQHTRLMSRRALGVLSALILIMGITILHASPPQRDQDNSCDNPKPKLSKEEKRRQKAVGKEMEMLYKNWPSEEVPYIITDQEREAFKKLSTGEERQAFIENFWERRNPNPGSPENAYKEEYYQRIIYANEHYGSGVPGWKTDRGRVYIMYGPPDEIDSHPSNEAYERPDSQGGGIITNPFEKWRYRYIDGIGTNVILEFIDADRNSEYHLTLAPSLKDVLLRVPSTGLTTPEQDWVQPPGQGVFPESMGVYTRLDLFTRAFQPPAVKFQDLKAIVTSRLSANLLPFDARVDFIRVTDETVLTPITVQVANSDLQFQNKDGVMHGALEVYGEITSRGDHIVNTFEKSLVFNLPEHEFQEYQKYKAVYQEAIPLRPARYKLSLVLKDGLNGHIGSEELGIVVPSFSVNELTSSSLILADQIMPLPNSHVIYGRVGSGPFWIGGTKVRPSANSTFTRDQRLGIYMQVYNLGIDDKTHKPSLDVRYEVEKDGRLLVDKPGYDANLKKASQQFTAVMIMPLRELAPGKYTVQIKVTDNIKKQSVSPSVALELR